MQKFSFVLQTNKERQVSNFCCVVSVSIFFFFLNFNINIKNIHFYKCRTPCKYPGKNIAFHVNEGSTDYWLSLLVEFEDGDGDVGSMHIREVSPFSTLGVS